MENNVSNQLVGSQNDKTLRDKLRRQKFGWFTMLFYGIGNVFWAYANNYRYYVNGIHKNVLNPAVGAVAGAFWITVIRETFYLFLFLIYAGPNLFIRRFKDTFTKGGRWMILAVFVNFIGNVMLATGYVFLVTAAFAGTIETSFIIFTFLATYFIFKQKLNKHTIIGITLLIFLLAALTYVQINKQGLKGEITKQLIGTLLIMLAQLGYMGKNIISEFVFKHKLLDVEGVQFMATFWSPFVALIGTLVFLPILQPILVASTMAEHSIHYAYLDASPFMLFIWMLRYWEILVIVFSASIFLLSGRNSQYQMTRVSGAALSNVFYQAKLVVQTLGTVIAYSIVIAISHTAFPVKTGNVTNPWIILTGGYFALWYYWVLIFTQVVVIVYTCIAGQPKFEENQHRYRKEKGIKDEAIDYSITDNIGISRRRRKHLSQLK